MKRAFLLIFAVITLCGAVAADEGNWLYEAFPKDQVKARYGFEPSQEFLDHLRLSSVRIGASASFVSPDGLVFTNHHVGAGCVHDLSTGGKDYMKDGYYARTRAEEAKCPGLEISVLTEIKDVTSQVQGVAKPEMAMAEAAQAQRAEMSRLEKECSTAANTRCEVVTLYAGAMYHLYKYRRYTDVRLVFAPEFEMAFFGGDPDNFTYPRYDLDITFFRVYENDKPVRPENYLQWSKNGVKEGDLVFVSGNPGSTGRLLTVAQLEYLRDLAYPFTLKSYARRVDMLKKFGAESPENSRVAERELFGLQNSFKAITGYQSGLLDPSLMAKKAADEKELRDYVNSDPKRTEQFGDPWDAIASAVAAQRELFLATNFIEGGAGLRGSMAGYARTLVRLTAEKEKPNDQRMRGFQDSAIPTIEQRLFSPAPIYRSLELLNLTDGLTDMRDRLGADNPVVKEILNGRTPAEAAKALIDGSKLDDVAFRKQLYAGGKKAVDASDDPLIVVMRTIDPEARAIRKQNEDRVEAVLRRNGGTVAKIRFAKYGPKDAPDATGTLRLNYGVVKGYTLNGQQVPWFTTMGGAFEHAAKHGDRPPYQLPASWIKAKSKMDLNTPLDTVNTVDSIGGNSGSPTVNTKGEIIGILFDGNIESLPWNFLFDDTVGRTVIVDSRGIIESLRKVYDAAPLADELTGATKN
ncbi:MAG: S46 family peptidase [Terriglobales bacterium]|jgi:hypothetical protein